MSITWSRQLLSCLLAYSTVKDSSVIAVQIFDQRKFKKRDQGFLGVVNVRVSDVIDLELGGHGVWSPLSLYDRAHCFAFIRDVNPRLEEVK